MPPWKRRHVFTGRAWGRTDEFETGQLLHRNDPAVEACRARKARQRLLHIGIPSACLLLILIFTLLAGFWAFTFVIVPALFLVVFVSVVERSTLRTVDLLPELYSRGVLTKDVRSLWVMELFFPYEYLDRVEVKDDLVHLIGSSRFARWSIHLDDLGQEGLQILMATMGGAPPPQGPPELVVYGEEGHREDGPPITPRY
jgi:hypothetical protein